MRNVSLRTLIGKEFERTSGIDDFSWVSERETELLSELNYNPNDVYPTEKEIPMNIEFLDNLGRRNITKGRLNNGHIEIKLYCIDETGSVKMNAPPSVTPKTMNTHLNNILTKFLPNGDRFLLQPMDSIRFRLFQLLLNRYADKGEWEIVSNPMKSEIVLRRRTE